MCKTAKLAQGVSCSDSRCLSTAPAFEAVSKPSSIDNPEDWLWNERIDRAAPETIERGARDWVVTVNQFENTTHPLLMANVVPIHPKSSPERVCGACSPVVEAVRPAGRASRRKVEN